MKQKKAKSEKIRHDKRERIDRFKTSFFIAPSFIGAAIFFILPFFVVGYYALIDNPISREFVGLQNFINLFDNMAFRTAAKNTAVFAAVAVLLRRRCGLRAAVWFAVSQLLVTAFWAPHQVQFFTCFAVAYAGCVWVLAKPRRSDDVCLALLVLGVVTSFCDLLVTPVLTLGLPLVCWLLEPQQRLRAGTRQCGIVVGGSLTWGVGYLLCWASKWVLAGLVTGQNVIADALHQVGVRTAADSWHGMELTWSNILRFVYTTLAGKHLFWPLVLAVVLLLALFAASIRDRQQLARALPLGLCALITPAWFIVLRTHSIQHGWFTWRALGLTVFAGLAFLYYCCDVRQIAKRLKRT